MTTNTAYKRIHPLIAAAAISVMLLSLVGVAAITGIIPNSYSSASQASAAKTAELSAPAQNLAEPSAISTAQSNVPTVIAKAQICRECGVVESVTAVQKKAAHGSGVGAVTGALLGGVLGNQVGGGNGRKLATVAGAVGGGYAGNEVERRANSTTVYHVRVRMEDGRLRTFTPSGQPGWREGDKVRVVNGRLRVRA